MPVVYLERQDQITEGLDRVQGTVWCDEDPGSVVCRGCGVAGLAKLCNVFKVFNLSSFRQGGTLPFATVPV